MEIFHSCVLILIKRGESLTSWILKQGRQWRGNGGDDLDDYDVDYNCDDDDNDHDYYLWWWWWISGEDCAEHVPEAQGLCGQPHRPGFNDDDDEDDLHDYHDYAYDNDDEDDDDLHNDQ